MKRFLVAAASLAALAIPPAAAADHDAAGADNASCVAEFVLPGAQAGNYGEFVASLAHDYQPLGELVSTQATSPRDACPF